MRTCVRCQEEVRIITTGDGMYAVCENCGDLEILR